MNSKDIPDSLEELQDRLDNCRRQWVRCDQLAKRAPDDETRNIYRSDAENWKLQGRLLKSMIGIKEKLKPEPLKDNGDLFGDL